MSIGPSDPDLQRLAELWDSFAEPEADGLRSRAAWNAAADEAQALEQRVLGAVGGAGLLAEVARCAPSEHVRRAAREAFRIDPYTALHEPDKFRADPRIALTAEQLPLTSALALVTLPEGEELLDWHTEAASLEEGRDLTRIGGHPTAAVVAAHPVDPQGAPMSLLAQVDLGSVAQTVPEAAAFPLPASGVMQFFIAKDGTSGAVRLLAEDELASFADTDVTPMAAARAMTVTVGPVTGLPSAALSETEASRFEFARSSLARLAADPAAEPIVPGEVVEAPLSSMFGPGHLESSAQDDLLLLEVIGPRDLTGSVWEGDVIQYRITATQLASGDWGAVSVVRAPLAP